MARLIAQGSLLAIAVFLARCSEEAPPPPPPPPPEVNVATVLQKDVPIYVEAVGQTQGSTEIEVRAQVEGILQTVDFKEGSQVTKGQLLYTIDPRELEANVAQANGALAQAQAQFSKAHGDVVRYEPLVAKNAIPKQDYDNAVEAQKAAAAQVDAAKAAVDRATVNLSYAKVEAPDSGLVGKTEVHPGTLVGKGENTLLTRISQIESIHVRFTIPEKDYLYYGRKRAEERAKGEVAPIPFELWLADGSKHPEPGALTFVDRNVDPKTGTILLEAAFPNPGGLVRPGSFAKIRAVVEQKKGAILVPQRAVAEMQGIFNVAVVGKDDVVELRSVKAGERVGSLWIIESGLNPGDRVVVEGVQKARPGEKVKPVVVTIEDNATPAATGG